MKNLFLVINKEKIYAYIVSVMTIVVIFFLSSTINSDIEDTESTASNVVEITENTQRNQNTEENKTVETNGEIGEAISTSTSSNTVVENNVQNSSVDMSNSSNE